MLCMVCVSVCLSLDALHGLCVWMLGLDVNVLCVC
jgi:hypothetical protein